MSLKVVNVAAEESLTDVVVTQEPTTLIVNMDMLEDTAPQEPVLLPLRNFINLDSEQEGHYKKEILTLTIEVSALRLEVTKWKIQVEEHQTSMIALSEHRKIIKALEERWAEERMAHRIREEELQSKLRELKKFQSMQREKEHMYTLSQEIMGTRKPSSSYPVFLFEQFV